MVNKNKTKKKREKVESEEDETKTKEVKKIARSSQYTQHACTVQYSGVCQPKLSWARCCAVSGVRQKQKAGALKQQQKAPSQSKRCHLLRLVLARSATAQRKQEPPEGGKEAGFDGCQQSRLLIGSAAEGRRRGGACVA